MHCDVYCASYESPIIAIENIKIGSFSRHSAQHSSSKVNNMSIRPATHLFLWAVIFCSSVDMAENTDPRVVDP